MMLKKYNKIILTILFFISCDEAIPPTISNGISAYHETEMYLYGWYNDKYQINLAWTDYYGCDSYDIAIPEIGYEGTTDTQIDHFHYLNDINYSPGYYFTAYVDCSEDQGVEYSDSVIVNTKAIDPIEDIIIYVEEGGYDDSLTFIHSSDTDIYKWYFYNFQFDQNDSNTHPYYFEHTHNEQSEWQQDIHPFEWEPEWPGYGGTNKLDYYKYTKTNLDNSYCYMIKVEDNKNNFRNSHIKCSDNYTRNANNPVEITSISDNLRRRIIITWEEYIDPDFYQYIIWRSEYEDMPENSIEKLAVVIENEQTIYHDRKNTSDGKKWYYKIEIQNQYGKSEFSEIKEGLTRP